MASIEILGINFECNDDEWRDLLDELTKNAFERAGVDPDDDDELFDDIKYDTMEDMLLYAIDGQLASFSQGKLGDVVAECSKVVRRFAGVE